MPTTDDKTATRTVLIAGAYGVLGTGVTDAALADPTRTVLTAGRRQPPAHHFAHRSAPENLSVDLLDAEAARAAIAEIRGPVDLVFAAYLDGGSMQTSIDNNVELLHNTLEALSAREEPVGRVALMGGAKAYGFHLGSMKTPAREDDPRIAAPIFYHQQEDLVATWAARNDSSWTVLRPHMVVGPSISSPMNLVTGLAVFAAISRELGVPLRFPGSGGTWSALHQFTDAELFGRATMWSLTDDSARNQVFNVTNGDAFRWKHLWHVLADAYGIPTDEPQPQNLEDNMPAMKSVWEHLVAKHALIPTPFDDIANWAFLDGCLNFDGDVVLSDVRIRQAGFHEVIDSHDSMARQVSRLREMRLVP